MDRLHHLTGRRPDHTYLDAELTAPLCHNCHEGCHDALRQARVDDPPALDSVLDLVRFGLSRVALFVGQLADSVSNELLSRIARTLSRYARLIGQAIGLLDEHVPEWRALLAEVRR